jgi:hypothetical protein
MVKLLGSIKRTLLLQTLVVLYQNEYLLIKLTDKSQCKNTTLGG